MFFSEDLHQVLVCSSWFRDRDWCGHGLEVVRRIILGLSGPFKNAPNNIIPDILLERTVANGQRSRRMAASHGLILDSSDMVFPQYKCTMTQTEYCCVACFFSIVLCSVVKVQRNNDPTNCLIVNAFLFALLTTLHSVGLSWINILRK